MRCEEHGLAAGPGGECVLCLRRARSVATRRAVVLSAAFVVVVPLICAGALLVRSQRNSAAATVTVVREATRDVSVKASAASSVSATATDRSVVATPPSVAETEPSQPPAVPAGSEATAAASPGASASTSASATGVAQASPAARIPSTQEVQAALRATPVLMFSTTWCPHCDRARRFFQANGIPVTDRDVEADAKASAELKRRTGGKAIPLIDVDGQQLPPGFSEEETLQAVASSVGRRLGVSGLRLRPAAVN